MKNGSSQLILQQWCIVQSHFALQYTRYYMFAMAGKMERLHWTLLNVCITQKQSTITSWVFPRAIWSMISLRIGFCALKPHRLLIKLTLIISWEQLDLYAHFTRLEHLWYTDAHPWSWSYQVFSLISDGSYTLANWKSLLNTSASLTRCSSSSHTVAQESSANGT